ncbi:hypothetical protein [Kitasatospora sp. NPDC088783]|uniref:hypothetical protein n=1 Tax=Kitasatospora sp. NPDC088783 TaxID=3364077 RepID=UPI0037F86154
MMIDLTAGQSRSLLRGALDGALDARSLTPAGYYPSRRHRPAFVHDIPVVVGARGAGKSVLARVLTDPALRAVASAAYRLPKLERAQAVTVLGEGGLLSAADVRAADAAGVEPRDLWAAAALAAVEAPGTAPAGSWQERAAGAQQALREAVHAGREEASLFLVFDGLEDLAPSTRGEHARALLQLACDLHRARSSRAPGRQPVVAKVFLAPDTLRGASGGDIPPVFELTWTDGPYVDARWNSLYALLLHLAAGRPGTEARALRAAFPGWEDGWAARSSALDRLCCDRRVLENAMAAFAEPRMGLSRTSGLVFSWPLVRLADAHGHVTPRSFLAFVQAALAADRAGGESSLRPLRSETVHRGLLAGVRVRALEEEQGAPWVAAALDALAGLQLPLPLHQVRERWAAAGVEEAHGPDLVGRLVDGGFLTRRSDGSLDMPDVYRIAWGLGRRGGVRRPEASA